MDSSVDNDFNVSTELNNKLHGNKIVGKRGRPPADQISILIDEGTKSDGKLKCDICMRNFPREKSLSAHRRTHTGEKPFICTYPDCERSFTQSGHLKTHERTHTDERCFSCPVEKCNTRFRHSNRKCPHHRQAKLIRTRDTTLSLTVREKINMGCLDPRVSRWLQEYIEKYENRDTSRNSVGDDKLVNVTTSEGEDSELEEELSQLDNSPTDNDYVRATPDRPKVSDYWYEDANELVQYEESTIDFKALSATTEPDSQLYYSVAPPNYSNAKLNTSDAARTYEYVSSQPSTSNVKIDSVSSPARTSFKSELAVGFCESVFVENETQSTPVRHFPPCVASNTTDSVAQNSFSTPTRRNGSTASSPNNSHILTTPKSPYSTPIGGEHMLQNESKSFYSTPLSHFYTRTPCSLFTPLPKDLKFPSLSGDLTSTPLVSKFSPMISARPSVPRVRAVEVISHSSSKDHVSPCRPSRSRRGLGPLMEASSNASYNNCINRQEIIVRANVPLSSPSVSSSVDEKMHNENTPPAAQNLVSVSMQPQHRTASFEHKRREHLASIYSGFEFEGIKPLVVEDSFNNHSLSLENYGKHHMKQELSTLSTGMNVPTFTKFSEPEKVVLEMTVCSPSDLHHARNSIICENSFAERPPERDSTLLEEALTRPQARESWHLNDGDLLLRSNNSASFTEDEHEDLVNCSSLSQEFSPLNNQSFVENCTTDSATSSMIFQSPNETRSTLPSYSPMIGRPMQNKFALRAEKHNPQSPRKNSSPYKTPSKRSPASNSQKFSPRKIPKKRWLLSLSASENKPTDSKLFTAVQSDSSACASSNTFQANQLSNDSTTESVMHSHSEMLQLCKEIKVKTEVVTDIVTPPMNQQPNTYVLVSDSRISASFSPYQETSCTSLARHGMFVDPRAHASSASYVEHQELPLNLSIH